MATRRKSIAAIYTLRIELQHIEPLIWRRLHVATDISLPKLHDVLQVVMGWTDSHLHSFHIGERGYTNSEDAADLNMLPEKGQSLGTLLGDSIREFAYEYDFGDGWEHRVVMEATRQPVADWPYPLCVAGERACPPEDIGGLPGYEEFLEAITDPNHEQHDEMLVWVGGAFDPEGFDINCVNRELRRRRL
jgi:Plasmid pRiA4b ORF-3-like protein